MQSRFGEPSGEGLGGLEQRQVRFNRVPEKGVPEKVPGGFVQRQVRFGFYRVSEKVPEKVCEALEQAEVFPALGFADG